MDIPESLKKIQGHNMTARKYTVWVGGSEVTQNLVNLERAEELVEEWKNKNYNDVSIEEVW